MRPSFKIEPWVRVSSSFSEALRNLITGTARGWWIALAFVFVVGGTTVFDSLITTSLIEDADRFRASGASIVVVESAGQIVGSACEGMQAADGVLSAGAIRRSPSEGRIASLPATIIPVFDVSPNFGSVLDVTLTGHGSGVILPRPLTDTLGLQTGGYLTLRDRNVAVVGTYEYPSDGRKTALQHAILNPTIAGELYDECWLDVWPSNAEMGTFWPLLVNASGDTMGQMQVSQLNATLGVEFDGSALFDKRPTNGASFLSLAGGIAIGLLWVRSRRLEFTAAIHAGVTKPALAVQMVMETILVFALATCIMLPVQALMSPGRDLSSLDINAARNWILGGSALGLGVILSVLTVRESTHFRNFQDR